MTWIKAVKAAITAPCARLVTIEAMPDTPLPPTYQVDLEPIGRRVQITAGQTLLDAARAAGIDMVAVCGGAGTCYTCLVRPRLGTLSELTPSEQAGLSAEQVALGYRLACQANPLSDVKVEIPPDSLATQQRLQLEGQGDEHAPCPLVEAIDVTVPPADLEDLRADTTRLQDAVEALAGLRPTFPHSILRDLSGQLRTQAWSVRLGLRRLDHPGDGSLVVAVTPASAPLLGLAADIGTTKIAAYLVDLATGRTLAKAGAVNPQISYGEDVLSRIAYAGEHVDGRATLQSRVANTLNALVAELCEESGTTPGQVAEAVIVGNTAMHHLFAGLPVDQLGRAPYVATISGPLDVPAHDLGLVLAPGAFVHLPSNIAGFVGADHVAMALGTGAWETQHTVVAVDIGTNTEVSVTKNGRVWCCSCASGPAFEGAHIRDGMRAAPGAIERVQIIDGQPRLKTIGNQLPVGLCGSGILDVVSELLRTGIVNRKGAFVEGTPGLGREGDLVHYLLAAPATTGHGRPIIVSRKDVNEIQLAKAAIRVGVDVLLHEANIRYDEIEDFIVAGAFGTYLDIASTVRTGMFPPLPLERFKQVGNAAGAGAKQMLISANRRAFAARRAREVTYVELTVYPEFDRMYLKALYF
jgi:uncharacterized 2Fe-2S/4Fe-4S cluster protein (DUF4445 family)